MGSIRTRIARLHMMILGLEPSPITREELVANYAVYELRRHIEKIESSFPTTRPDFRWMKSILELGMTKREAS